MKNNDKPIQLPDDFQEHLMKKISNLKHQKATVEILFKGMQESMKLMLFLMLKVNK